MKHLKKLASLALALVMVMALAAPAFAAGEKITVTVKDLGAGYSYTAYQIFTGVATDDGSGFDITAPDNNIGWGKDILVGKQSEFLHALQDDETIGAYFTGITSNGGVDPKAVAQALAKARKELEVDTGKKDVVGPIVIDILTDPDKAILSMTAGTPLKAGENQLDCGYYLFRGAKGNLDPFYNLYQLTAEGLEIKPKTTDVPKLDKQIKDPITGEWQDASDFDIDDDVEFQITATLPDNFLEMNNYSMTFTDTQDAGFDKPDKVTVRVIAEEANGAAIENAEITLGSPADYTYTEVSDNDFTIAIANAALATGRIKPFATTYAGKVIKVVLTYETTLNSSAVIGNGDGTTGGPGNVNTVKLTWDGDGGQGEEEDKATGFTFEFDANKVDGNGDALEGATFTLYQWVKKDTNGKETTGPVAPDDTWTNNTWSSTDESNWSGENGTWRVVATQGGRTGAGKTDAFEFKGLRQGFYMLVEDETPSDAYNEIDPIFFDIVATYPDKDANTANLKVTELNIEQYKAGENGNYKYGENKAKVGTPNITTGTIDLSVENNQGVVLPSTGGIGTTIFYIVGGVLLVGAVVLLIAKRRTSADEE